MKCEHIQPNKLNIPVDLSNHLDDIEYLKKLITSVLAVPNSYLLGKSTSVPTQAELEHQKEIYKKYLTRRK